MGQTAKSLIPVLALVGATLPAGAAELRTETLKAWTEYVQGANSCMMQRLQAGHTFLWTDEHPEIARKVQAGAIITAPMTPDTPRRVPFGLIHHWIGAVVIPDARREDVFAIIRDYDRYNDYYHPAVLAAKAIRQTAGQDEFSMMLMSKAVLARTALDSDYHSTYVQVDGRRWYSVSYTTRVQEIEQYGEPDEHTLPPDQGHGYLWRLYSITRFEERNGGVFIEVEAMALSRDIPAALRWLVDPLVRRLSRNSLITTLRQTQEAVGAEAAAATWRAPAQSGSCHPR